MSFIVVFTLSKLSAKLYLYFRLSDTPIVFFTNKLFITLYNILIPNYLKLSFFFRQNKKPWIANSIHG